MKADKIPFVSFVPVLALLLPALCAAAQTGDRQFQSRAALIDGLPLSITVVAPASDEGRAQAAMSAAVSRAISLDSALFSANGIEARLGSLPAGQRLELTPDAFDMFKRSVELAALTNGWYDIAGPSPKSWFVQRDWRRIALDESSRTVALKSDGMRFDLRRISLGYIADIAMEEIAKVGFANAMVEAGPVSRISGRDIFTPWKIQIGFGGGGMQLAHRAYDYNLTNVSAATVTADGLGRGLVDPRNKHEVAGGGAMSVTVFAKDAAAATAYALAAYALGPKIGLRFIEAHPEAKGIIVDAGGNLFASKGLRISNANSAPPDQKQAATSDGGPDDMRMKEKEEAQDL